MYTLQQVVSCIFCSSSSVALYNDLYVLFGILDICGKIHASFGLHSEGL